MLKFKHLEFGIEELAVVLSLTGKLNEAKSLLSSKFGEISDDEEKGRLLAAHNSLLARNIIMQSNGKPILDQNANNLIDIFSQSKKIIRFGKSTKNGEELISYYEHRDAYLEHSIIHGVAHRFHYPVGNKEIEEKAKSFFSPRTSPKIRKISIEIPSSKILNMPIGGWTTQEEVIALICDDEGAITTEVQQLASDIVNAKWRGITTWINHPGTEYLFTKGYLWIQGEDALWMINSVDVGDSNRLKAETCSKKDFSQKIERLIQTIPNLEEN